MLALQSVLPPGPSRGQGWVSRQELEEVCSQKRVSLGTPSTHEEASQVSLSGWLRLGPPQAFLTSGQGNCSDQPCSKNQKTLVTKILFPCGGTKSFYQVLFLSETIKSPTDYLVCYLKSPLIAPQHQCWPRLTFRGEFSQMAYTLGARLGEAQVLRHNSEAVWEEDRDTWEFLAGKVNRKIKWGDIWRAPSSSLSFYNIWFQN